jgi:ankyrin repeat protein
MDAQLISLARQVFAAARAGDTATLARYLDAGGPVDLRNEKGDTLLMLASYHGHLDATWLLLERGADPDLANDRGQRPLAGAAFRGDTAIARLLLEHGADREAATPDGKTALDFAMMFQRDGMVALLSRPRV